MEHWFKFSAYGEQHRYGYGTELQASDYQDKLNWSRAAKHYIVYKLSEAEAKALGLEQNSEAVNLYEELASE
jgi:hypothetical protein